MELNRSRGLSWIVALGLSAAWAGEKDVPWHHPLSCDAGGYWTLRVPVEIENLRDEALAGAPIQVKVQTSDGTAGLIGTPIVSVRVVASSGSELLFDVHDGAGNAKRQGVLASGDAIVLPAETPSRGKSTLFLYAGNRTGWLPPDWLKWDKAKTPTDFAVRVLPSETLKLKPIGEQFLWPGGAEWAWRAPLRVRNFTDRDLPKAVARLDARHLGNRMAKLIGFANPPCLRVVDPQTPAKPLPYTGSLSEDLLVVTSLPARSEKTLWLYLSENTPAAERSPKEPLAGRVTTGVHAAAGELETLDLKFRAGELSAWIVNPLVKVFAEDLPPLKMVQQVRVHAARNEYEAFQVAVRSLADGALKVSASSLVGADGARIDGPVVWHARRVPVDFPAAYASAPASEPDYYRHLPSRRGTDGWPGGWPDPLAPLRQEGVTLTAGKTEALWLDVRVPASAVPGEYQGSVELQAQGLTVRIPVSLTVWNFTQPQEKHLPALYDLRQHPGGLHIFAGRDQGEMVRTWYRFMAPYNVFPSFVIPEPTFKREGDKVAMDAAKFDEAAHYLLDVLHINKVYTPSIFYGGLWAYETKKFLDLQPFTPEWERAWTEAYQTFMDHITRKGWRRKFVYYLADEPFEERISELARLARMARHVAPDVPVYASARYFIEGLQGHLTLWGIWPHGLWPQMGGVWPTEGTRPGFPEERIKERRAAGHRFWFTADGQMCIDTPLLAIERLLPWLCFKYDVDGYEFWGVSVWPHDPWQYGGCRFFRPRHGPKTAAGPWVRFPNGAGYLAYPGSAVGQTEPVPSIRLVAAREGVDDYEMFLALRPYAEQGRSEAREALERVAALAPKPKQRGRYSTALMPDPEAVHAARVAAGEALSNLAR